MLQRKPSDKLNTTNRTTVVNILDLWGIFRSSSISLIVIAVTAILVGSEAKYNIDLLNTLSDETAGGASASDLADRGKLLASFGIAWAMGRSILTGIKPALLGIALFLVLVTATYIGLDQIYTKVISNLKPEIKVKGFNLFAYRHELLAGTMEDPEIPLPKNEPVIGKIFMGAFPMVI